jgi:hypothetical protein
MQLDLDMTTTERALTVVDAPNPIARKTQFDRLYEEYMAMEEEQARKAGRVGYVAHVFVHAALPYRRPVAGDNEELEFWMRSSNKTKLVIQSGARLSDTGMLDKHGRPVHRSQRIGIPYGSFPRILLAFLASEVVLKGSPEIELGGGVRDWFGRMGIRCTGGPNGTIRAVRTQLDRLMNAKISITEQGEALCEGQFLLAEGQRPGPEAWWNDDKTISMWQPRFMLSPTFFQSLKNRAVPINLRAMTALCRCPLAMDLYVWTSYRSDELRKDFTLVPWRALWNQFGSDSAMNKFQENVRRALGKVQTVYPELQVKADRNGLKLFAYKASVPRLAA